jgi:hypothetical protein
MILELLIFILIGIAIVIGVLLVIAVIYDINDDWIADVPTGWLVLVERNIQY